MAAAWRRLLPYPVATSVHCRNNPQTAGIGYRCCQLGVSNPGHKDLEADRITEASTWEELGLDSLDTVELVMNMEDAFGISLEMTEDMKSVGDVVKAIDVASPASSQPFIYLEGFPAPVVTTATCSSATMRATSST